MMEIVRTPLGSVSVAPKALTRLVEAAAEEVDGAQVVRGGRTLRVSVEDDATVTVALAIAASRRVVLPDLARHVQQRVSDALGTALGARPAAVDVTIEAVREDAG